MEKNHLQMKAHFLLKVTLQKYLICGYEEKCVFQNYDTPIKYFSPVKKTMSSLITIQSNQLTPSLYSEKVSLSYFTRKEVQIICSRSHRESVAVPRLLGSCCNTSFFFLTFFFPFSDTLNTQSTKEKKKSAAK